MKRKFRDKRVEVPTLGSDREIARHLNPFATEKEIEALAAVRAVARSVAVDERSTIRALEAITAGIPALTLRRWFKDRFQPA